MNLITNKPPSGIDSLRAALLAWHDASARDLPWRGERDPYRIWVSEIMLQQTRAETVIPYYLRFLEAFPTPRALADAQTEHVLKLWEGLGYYSRARNLQKAARLLCEALGGVFPTSAAGLRKLPGVGEYTAGAIASIAFSQPEPAIDGNQIRVLSRLFDLRGLISKPETKKALAEAARLLIDRARPGDFNQALMGLGALLCVPRKPDCARCPVRDFCAARASGVEKSLPTLPEKTDKRIQVRAVALVYRARTVYVRKRPDEGLLASLWEFPNFENARTDADALAALEELSLRAAPMGEVCRHKHVFTHLIWQMTGFAYRAIDDCTPREGRFVTKEELEALPMPTALAPFRAAAAKQLNAIESRSTL